MFPPWEYVKLETVEAPTVQGMVVFTACSCRTADIAQFFEFDDSHPMGDGVIYNGPADFVVDIPHPALLLIASLADSVELLGLTQLLAAFGLASP